MSEQGPQLGDPSHAGTKPRPVRRIPLSVRRRHVALVALPLSLVLHAGILVGLAWIWPTGPLEIDYPGEAIEGIALNDEMVAATADQGKGVAAAGQLNHPVEAHPEVAKERARPSTPTAAKTKTASEATATVPTRRAIVKQDETHDNVEPTPAARDPESEAAPKPRSTPAPASAKATPEDAGAVPDARPEATDVMADDARGNAPAILSVGIEQSEHGGQGKGVGGADLAGSPDLGAFIGGLQAKIAGQAHLADAYREAHPKYRDERIFGCTVTLLLRLRGDGSVEQVSVHEGSGTKAFDDEAMAAIRRARPLPPPPARLLDERGAFTMRFSFHLDLAGPLFYSDVGRAVVKRWQPSRAYRRFGGATDRTTVLRILVGPTGNVVYREIQASAGIEFLDQTTLDAVPVGTYLATPPSGLRPPGHLIPVRVKFLHAARGDDLVTTSRDRADGNESPNAAVR